jgi:hypothetical protein
MLQSFVIVDNDIDDWEDQAGEPFKVNRLSKQKDQARYE